MAIRTVLKFPDPRLRMMAAPVTVFDDELLALATDLIDTMRAASGIGITAPHIGIATRLVALELSPETGPQIYVNPVIVWAATELTRNLEGSVSMPGVTSEIERSAQIRVRYADLNGTEQVEEASGLRAVCHQHEIDQLDGIFWIQKLSPLKRERLVKRWQKLQQLS